MDFCSNEQSKLCLCPTEYFLSDKDLFGLFLNLRVSFLSEINKEIITYLFYDFISHRYYEQLFIAKKLNFSFDILEEYKGQVTTAFLL